ncbi:MAG: EF-hand domain-containing protein [Alphaproteobacteria bacterium]|nr:EF-hand domain-containing protein [Alphaproteobacteria bacterium]
MTSISGTGGGSSSLIQMLQQRFREADSDGDDALSLDEFTAAGPPGAQGGGGAKGPDPSELFAKLDSDGDGSVSKDEFTTAFSKFGSGAKSALLDAQELFANANANGDGALSEDEFAASALKGPPRGGPPPGPPPASGDAASVSDIFDELDANGDGSLTEDEFAAALEKQTASSSADDDAQLLNLLKQASDLYASLTARNAAASSVAVSA